MTEALLIAVLIVGIANLALVILFIGGRRDAAREIDRLKRDMLDEQRALRAEVSENTRRSINAVGETLLNEYQRDTLNQEQRFKTFALENAQRMEQIRRSVERQLADIREDNGKKLDEMRSIVDEKLQKTLEDKLSRSFALVSERLEQVYKGLGEMQTLASGVGDLSKVLSNVKTRGILGEIQLGAILGEMMAPEQYEVNAKVKQATNDGTVLLPIDSKFPADAYTNLMDAYEQGNADAVKAAQAVLKGRIKEFAADIAKKYINPPYTTEFAVMFLPTEGLYAEVLRLNLMEPIQREYRVSIAGPSTMAALLNSLQMGFKTLAIQKRSGEVWQLLGAVKTEFDKFGQGLSKMQQRLRQTDEELDNLIGVRSRAISRKLRAVQTMDDASAAALLELDTEPGGPVSARLPESRGDE